MITFKQGIEHTNNCKFISKRGVKRKLDDSQETRLYCHRDGYFDQEDLEECDENTAENRKRDRKHQVKSQGSNKINASCPSQMVIRRNQEGKYHVVYIKTHLGHKCEAAYLDLPLNEKAEIVGKLKIKFI